ncbi:uncharacterized protein LOC113101067 isoform X1 [Carassius auratus]|uniref:Uncharacterized protein LOC113101067 isoform X1 n=1 Tax=Carassius auratus TaxID=7957 RepID=A0A6P6PIA8_CARAU|nr:uncharacterized protein LOC113101067 isoform X1 [Carassius auratus]
MEGLKFSSNTMQVSFVCQRCSQPLKLDTSFNVLDRMTFHELTAPLLTVTANKQSESSEGSRFPEHMEVTSHCSTGGTQAEEQVSDSEVKEGQSEQKSVIEKSSQVELAVEESTFDHQGVSQERETFLESKQDGVSRKYIPPARYDELDDTFF